MSGTGAAKAANPGLSHEPPEPRISYRAAILPPETGGGTVENSPPSHSAKLFPGGSIAYSSSRQMPHALI